MFWARARVSGAADTSSIEMNVDGFIVVTGRSSQIVGSQSGVLRNSGQHSWTDFFTVMKCEDKVEPAISSQYAV